MYVLLEQRHEARLFKVMVCRQRLSLAVFLHHHERNAIGQRPGFSLAIMVKLPALLEVAMVSSKNRAFRIRDQCVVVSCRDLPRNRRSQCVSDFGKDPCCRDDIARSQSRKLNCPHVSRIATIQPCKRIVRVNKVAGHGAWACRGCTDRARRQHRPAGRQEPHRVRAIDRRGWNGRRPHSCPVRKTTTCTRVPSGNATDGSRTIVPPRTSPS